MIDFTLFQFSLLFACLHKIIHIFHQNFVSKVHFLFFNPVTITLIIIRWIIKIFRSWVCDDILILRLSD